MRLEYYDQGKLKQEILNLLGKHLDLGRYKVFFFGSRVNGSGDERSDIDIGIEGSEPVPWSAMLDIKEELEDLDTLYKIEVIDFFRAGKNFELVAKQYVESIN